MPPCIYTPDSTKFRPTSTPAPDFKMGYGDASSDPYGMYGNESYCSESVPVHETQNFHTPSWFSSVYPQDTYAAHFPGALLGHMVEKILPAPKVSGGLPRPATATKRFNEPLFDLPPGFAQWTPYTIIPRSNEPRIYSPEDPKYWIPEGEGSGSPDGHIHLDASTHMPFTFKPNEPHIYSPNYPQSWVPEGQGNDSPDGRRHLDPSAYKHVAPKSNEPRIYSSKYSRFCVPQMKGNDSLDRRIHLDASTHERNPDVFHYVQPSPNRLRDPRGRMLLDHLHAAAMRTEEKEAVRRYLPISPLTPIFPRDIPSPASFTKVNTNVEPRAAFDLRVDTTIDSRIVERLSRLLVPNCPPESMLAWEIHQRWRREVESELTMPEMMHPRPRRW